MLIWNVGCAATTSGVWARRVCFSDDLFRRRFLEVLGIRSCVYSCLGKLNKTIAEVACDVAAGLSSEFLSLIENG